MFNPAYFYDSVSTKPLLLDLYTGSAGAYSLRLIRGAYVSLPILRIRRTVTTGTADVYIDQYKNISLDSPITIISGSSSATTLGQYVKASGYTNPDGLGSSASAFVSIWYDQSGNSKDAIQNTDASQPRIVNSGVLDTDGSKACLYFNGSNELSISSFTSILSVLNNYSVFTVHNLNASTGTVLRSSISTNNRFAINYTADQKISFQAYNGTFFSKTTNLSSRRRISTSLFFTPNTMTSYVDTVVSDNTILTGGTSATATTTIGTGYFNTIQEIIIYPSNISSSRTVIELNINTFYNIY